MHLLQLFDASFLGRREQIALEWQGQTYTFGDLDLRSNRVAHLLASQGIEAGHRVAVHLPNCLGMVDLYLATLKLGAIFVPINILYRERELGHILKDSSPQIFIDRELGSEADAFPSTRPLAVLSGDTPACLIYTSGTTGPSKGAILTHHNFAVNAINLLHLWQITAQDRLLLALPLFHVHGLGNGLHTWLLSGLRLRLLARFESARAAQEFLDFSPTLFFGVPTMYVRLLDLDDSDARRIGQFMRLFVCGSAPLPAQVLEDFRAKFGSTILERYGMSEALMLASNPYLGERRPGSVGSPLPGVSIQIEDGELYVRGPNLCQGYWGKPPFLPGAWFRTGDLASLSPDGYLTLQGRRSDLIISGGFNIYPREIEEFLLEQAGVVEVAVVARPCQSRGEVPVAFVVTAPGCDVVDLETRCRESLASFKVPRTFYRVDSLPRNALGKVQKHLLAANREDSN